MADKAKGWTEGEKLELIFQIVEKSGTIPWDDLTLPEGRIRKACSVMIDRERAKVRKAREARANGGEGVTESIEKTTSAKRKADGEAGGKAKKAATSRKKKTKTPEEDADGDEVLGDVKPDVEAQEKVNGIKLENDED